MSVSPNDKRSSKETSWIQMVIYIGNKDKPSVLCPMVNTS